MSDSDDPQPDDWKAVIVVPAECAILLFILPVLVLDRCGGKRDRSTTGKRTRSLIIAVFITNTIFQITWILRATACHRLDCHVINTALFTSRALLKGTNLIFLIHRAKLVQAMTPILSKKCFEMILPSIIIACTLVFAILATPSTLNKDYHCAMYDDSTSVHFC